MIKVRIAADSVIKGVSPTLSMKIASGLGIISKLKLYFTYPTLLVKPNSKVHR